MDTLIEQNKQNPSTGRFKLETLKRMYYANEEKSYARCVELGVNIFWDTFNNQILQLLNAFPEDHIIEETGKPFWSGLKRAPSAIPLDLNDPIHVDVVQAAANIYAVVFGIPMEKDVNVVKGHAQNVEPIKFVPKKIKI